MRAFYTDRFVLPLPDGHRFPMVKYARVRERCLAEGILEAAQVSEPEAATWEQLALAHDREYLARVRDGELSPLEQRRIGFPWSVEMVERSRRSVGATIEAGRVALADARLRGWGIAANLAGGTHHAHSGHGEGFCVFNDAAVATRVLQSEGKIARAAIIDCDVHQGNGTAAIFSTDPTVLTFSIHGSRNYPFRRERSSIDVDLPDGTGDEAFLCALDLHVPRLLDDHHPDLVIYLAGADPFRDDRYGRLSLSKEGLAARDSLVLDACRERAVPVALTMA
ncbi:MAG: histone deacetylase, partial [Gemmatimonadetes bacterium]|nr:histone deacetylase [Gemmatimonadota bacterium]